MLEAYFFGDQRLGYIDVLIPWLLDAEEVHLNTIRSTESPGHGYWMLTMSSGPGDNLFKACMLVKLCLAGALNEIALTDPLPGVLCLGPIAHGRLNRLHARDLREKSCFQSARYRAAQLVGPLERVMPRQSDRVTSQADKLPVSDLRPPARARHMNGQVLGGPA